MRWMPAFAGMTTCITDRIATRLPSRVRVLDLAQQIDVQSGGRRGGAQVGSYAIGVVAVQAGEPSNQNEYIAGSGAMRGRDAQARSEYQSAAIDGRALLFREAGAG